MITHTNLSKLDFRDQIRRNKIRLGGNRKLKIYGNLHCASGKRMKVKNRVFFENEQEAIAHGYRPCGHCMRAAYQQWKNGIV